MSRKPNRGRASEGRGGGQDAAAPGGTLQPAGPRREGPRPHDPPAGSRQRGAAWAVCGFLLLAIALVYGQTLQFGFVNYDDGLYVYENPTISHGLNLETAAWALTATHGSLWAPVTWFSWLADSQLYGVSPWGFHLTNVLLHATTTVLLFLVLRRMTGDLWPSALVAAVFAIHPLQAESVAWVAERKGLLAGLFFVLALGAYLRYVRRGSSRTRYVIVVAMFALGLMAKPVLVTFPFVLLLLDYWPLKRMEDRGWLIVEKLPLFLLAAAACAVAPLTQGKAVVDLELLPLPVRGANAVAAYVAYLGQFFCPVNLSAAYPHPKLDPANWKVAVAGLLLAGISAAAIARWRRNAYLPIGWLWYLGMLVPVIGLVQVGGHARADRYMYLPMIGLCIALAWGAAELTRRWPGCRRLYALAAPPALAALMVLAWCQTAYWRQSETLWNHALDCDPRNSVAHTNLAGELITQGRFPEAMEHLQLSLQISPANALAQSNLGVLLLKHGQLDEALPHLQAALDLEPSDPQVLVSFGLGLATRGQISEAMTYFRKAIAIDPEFVTGHSNLGTAWAKLGRLKEAAEEFHTVAEITPGSAQAHVDLAEALAELGRVEEAAGHYRLAIVLAEQQHQDALAKAVRARLQALESKRSSKEDSPLPPPERGRE